MTKLGWAVAVNSKDEPHVFPIDDLMDHYASRTCWCKPIDDEGIMVHHAIDCREDNEPIN